MIRKQSARWVKIADFLKKPLSKQLFSALVVATMNINTMTLPSTSSQPLQSNPGSSRFASFGRMAMATFCVSLVSFAAVPKALAAEANGTYEFKSASGSLKIDGDNYRVPQSLVKKLAGFANGEVTIQNNTLKLRKNATANIVEEIGDDWALDVEASVSGPNTVVLSKTGDTYTGKTAGPIVATFEGDFFGLDFSGELITRVSATVKGDTLTVVIKFSGEMGNEDFSGKLTLVGKR